MFTALYTAKSGMTVQQTNIDLHSHNLSNVSTTGFKRNFANVEDLAYQNYRQVGAAATEQNQLPTGLHMGLGARTVSIGRNFEQGSLQESKNSLDVAINGNGFFEVTMPDGTIGYTRDGSFKVDAQGRLVTSGGLPVANGITIPPNATNISISNDGAVSATVPGNTQPQPLGNLAMSGFVNAGGLEPIGQNLFKESAASGQPQQGTPGTNGAGHHQAGVSGVFQRERGGRAGEHDPDPARLRDEFQGHLHHRPDAGQAEPALSPRRLKKACHEPHRIHPDGPPHPGHCTQNAGRQRQHCPGGPSHRLRQHVATAPGGYLAHRAAAAHHRPPRCACARHRQPVQRSQLPPFVRRPARTAGG